ncbi:hypothetical protein GCM10007913_33780 [Devosia yakushimensis]|uniref:Variable large protein n=1 Tax=Devosia yakushimensis TaxID=470028 RepID=A0ABQ5UHK1_9HYPH|nr:hypothetical protein GCM10007913_33780 [Devosia yakushimensis]
MLEAARSTSVNAIEVGLAIKDATGKSGEVGGDGFTGIAHNTNHGAGAVSAAKRSAAGADTANRGALKVFQSGTDRDAVAKI